MLDMDVIKLPNERNIVRCYGWTQGEFPCRLLAHLSLVRMRTNPPICRGNIMGVGFFCANQLLSIFSNQAHLLTCSSLLPRMKFQTNIGSLESSTDLNLLMIGTCRLTILSGSMKVQRFMSTALHIRANCHNVIGWWLVLTYMQTPPIHYYLEFSGLAAYMETHLRRSIIQFSVVFSL